MERLQARWARTAWFRCETCEWRGRLRDVWSPDQAFCELPSLRLGRELNIEVLQQRDEETVVAMALSRRNEIGQVLRVWLDDSRPAPLGWLRLGSVTSVQRLLDARLVQELSLDYDLGWCPDCIQTGEHLKSSGQRHCSHMATGYDLVVWMADRGCWPAQPPGVHSGNLDGGARMLGLIARHWPTSVPGPTSIPVTADGEPVPTPECADARTHAHASASSLPDHADGRAAVAALTVCPNCQGPDLHRTHRHSNVERLRSLLTRRYPARCSSCGWARWVRDPILVRFSSGTDQPSENIDPSLLDRIQPSEGNPK
jgi:hypothetical protein